jgi:hypothetical protein
MSRQDKEVTKQELKGEDRKAQRIALRPVNLGI